MPSKTEIKKIMDDILRNENWLEQIAQENNGAYIMNNIDDANTISEFCSAGGFYDINDAKEMLHTALVEHENEIIDCFLNKRPIFTIILEYAKEVGCFIKNRGKHKPKEFIDTNTVQLQLIKDGKKKYPLGFYVVSFEPVIPKQKKRDA